MATQEVAQPPKDRSRFFYGYIVVIAAFIIMAVSYGTYGAFGVFFRPVLTEFGWNRVITSGAFSVSMITQGLLGIVMGRLTDRLGPRMVLRMCGFLLGVGYVLMSQTSAVWQLYLFYGVIIGTGMSGTIVPLLSTTARWFVGRRNVMTGVVLTGMGIGSLITPPLADSLISAYDWRVSYILFGSGVLISIFLAAQFLRRDPNQMGQLPYGHSKGAAPSLTSDSEGLSLREAAHTRQFWLLFTILLCYGFAAFVIIVHIVPHGIDLGISAASAANILATFGGLTVVGMVVIGSAAERIGGRQAYIIGFILMSAALLLLLPSKEVWMLYLFAGIFGFARGGTQTLPSPLVATLFGLKSHGLIWGVMAFAFTIGAAIGPFLAGYIFDAAGSYHMAFVVCATASIVSLILAVILRPISRPEVKKGLP